MTDDQDQASEPVRWQKATLDMVELVDVEEIVGGLTSPDAYHHGREIAAALEAMPDDAPGRPLLEMLHSILGMHEQPNRTPPFGPMLRMADGSRSAAPEDFEGPLVEVVVATLGRLAHPVPRARLAHLTWFLERRRRDVGLEALRAYVTIAERLDDGRLVARREQGLLSITGRDVLRMGLAVGRGLGWPDEEVARLKGLVADLLDRACAQDEDWSVRAFADLALDVDAVPPQDVARAVERFMERNAATKRDDGSATLWLLVARAHRRAKNEAAAHAATAKAAECYAALAESFVGKPHAAMIAAHWMGLAIFTYHGVPDARDRRQALRHRLIDIQGSIREDLVPVSHSTDITDLVKATRKSFSGLPLHEALRRLCMLERPPEPEKLVRDAYRQMVEAPLSSLFATMHMDAEGKTVARSPGRGIGYGDVPDEALETKIVQSEEIRRSFAVHCGIEVARSTIMLEHHVPEAALLDLLRWSPALPPRLLHTAARGFVRWFEGDMVSALYVLTPLVEGILRHVLKQHDHDVTTFDDATGVQEDRTITSLYDALRPEMDAIFGRALTEDVRRVFLSRPGPSLRHGVAHALLSDGVPYGDDANYACWLIWIVVVWPLLPHWEEVTVMPRQRPAGP